MKHKTKLSFKEAVKKYGNPPEEMIIQERTVNLDEECQYTETKRRLEKIGGEPK